MAKWLNKWYMVNDKMVNGFMEKKHYIIPQSEVMQFGTDIIMEAFGPGSAPADPFNAAPKPRGPKAF